MWSGYNLCWHCMWAYKIHPHFRMVQSKHYSHKALEVYSDCCLLNRLWCFVIYGGLSGNRSWYTLNRLPSGADTICLVTKDVRNSYLAIPIICIKRFVNTCDKLQSNFWEFVCVQYIEEYDCWQNSCKYTTKPSFFIVKHKMCFSL